MKKKAEDHKFEIPELPDELKRVSSPKDKAYLDYIKVLQQKLKQDYMTGLEHKEQFETSSKAPGVFIYLDGDGLKKLNDTLGHEAGTAAILALAQGMKLSIRSRDDVEVSRRKNEDTQLSRQGGDEFAVHIDGASVSTGVIIAKRMLETINNQRLSDFYKGSDPKIKEILSQLTMKASLGVGKTKEEADKALYEAKQKGRNRVEFFKSLPKVALLSQRITQLASMFNKVGKTNIGYRLANLNKRAEFYYKEYPFPYARPQEKLTLHRIDGPAYILGTGPNAKIEYWVDGFQLDPKVFEEIRTTTNHATITYYLTGPSLGERALAKIRGQELYEK